MVGSTNGTTSSVCGRSHTKSQLFYIKDALSIVFLPLSIITVIQILSYRAIVNSASNFNLDEARIRTINKVRKTFVIVVIVFFVLVTPAHVYIFIMDYLIKYHTQFSLDNKDNIIRLRSIFNLVLTFNSAVNPFIYAKIHRRFVETTQNTSEVAQRSRESAQSNLELLRRSRESAQSNSEKNRERKDTMESNLENDQ